MIEYDKLREELGRSLSNLASGDKDAVHEALLSACHELNVIEFGTNAPRCVLNYVEYSNTTSSS